MSTILARRGACRAPPYIFTHRPPRATGSLYDAELKRVGVIDVAPIEDHVPGSEDTGARPQSFIAVAAALRRRGKNRSYGAGAILCNPYGLSRLSYRNDAIDDLRKEKRT